MKTVLFVPGYQEDLTSRDYRSAIQAIENHGYKVAFVPIHWKRTTIDDWVSELMAVYDTYDPSKTILAGFSFGAMTAFVAAAQRNPAALWLFSLSGYFKEDIQSKAMRKSWLTALGHRRVSAFSRLDYPTLASAITCRTLLFAGATELVAWPTMKHRTTEAPKYLQNCQLTIVDGVGHDVADKQYVAAIEQLL